MQYTQLDPADRKLLFSVNKNLEWMKLQMIKSQPAEEWGSYADIVKILNRSKSWFKSKRLDSISKDNILVPAELQKGRDWRLVGNRTEYRIAAIHELKVKLANNS
jgi:hypothetical protein